MGSAYLVQQLTRVHMRPALVVDGKKLDTIKR